MPLLSAVGLLFGSGELALDDRRNPALESGRHAYHGIIEIDWSPDCRLGLLCTPSILGAAPSSSWRR
jgi:hypothetical protein